MPSLAGSLLVARPSLKDQFFGRSVVLLMQHGPEGAFGLVLNRPAKMKEAPLPVSIGGPCKFEGFLLLHGHREWLKEEGQPEGEVIDGVYLGDASIMEKVADPPPGAELRFRMFAGYSGWGANQLERELGEGSWAVVEAHSTHVFDIPAEELWEKVVPPTIPAPSLN